MIIITNCDSTTFAFDPRVSPRGVPLWKKGRPFVIIYKFFNPSWCCCNIFLYRMTTSKFCCFLQDKTINIDKKRVTKATWRFPIFWMDKLLSYLVCVILFIIGNNELEATVVYIVQSWIHYLTGFTLSATIWNCSKGDFILSILISLQFTAF